MDSSGDSDLRARKRRAGRHHCRRDRGDEIPARALTLAPEPVLRARADALRRHLDDAGVDARVIHVEGQVGGGTLPLARPRSWACVLEGDAEALATRLRTGEPSVLARIEDPDVAPLAAAVVAARTSLPGA